ncbi:MAG: MFS transporter, partial [Gammaproteobacteria bacterium]
KMAPMVGAIAIALIGVFNIVGSFLSGVIGQRFSKKFGLSWIYGLRAAVLLIFLLAPKTAPVIYVFAATMGLLWLSTVPLTVGIVSQVFGIRYMATLFGFVFLSHQVGSFIGVWLGGYLYDMTGSYDLMWQAGVFMGVLAAIVHLPIDENPVARLQQA